ncbi:unnamed protein product [Amoebophrya sp. A25]|nr:unnamed protein product [Amoebophrya sp. A25]|eukprot:GSA25T00013282001.1
MSRRCENKQDLDNLVIPREALFFKSRKTCSDVGFSSLHGWSKRKYSSKNSHSLSRMIFSVKSERRCTKDPRDDTHQRSICTLHGVRSDSKKLRQFANPTTDLVCS